MDRLIHTQCYQAHKESTSILRHTDITRETTREFVVGSLMADNLFVGLPPPSSISIQSDKQTTEETTPAQPAAPVPVLKSALKRKNPPTEDLHQEAAATSQKGVRFKTTVDASEKQVIEAMQKIASHIKNPTKFKKASKLAVQLIQAGSVKPGTSDYFFAILEAAMSLTTGCTDPSLRVDYHALFSAAQEVTEFLSKRQKHQLASWSLRAVLGNDLYTDDSFETLDSWKVLGITTDIMCWFCMSLFQFSKAAAQVKETISNFPVATKDDDVEEAEVLTDKNNETPADDQDQENVPLVASNPSNEKAELDPFGLDALLSETSKKHERMKGKKEALAQSKKAEEESKRFLRSQREAIIHCLEIAARRYKLAWCQTVVDILVKHAYDNIDRFTSQQRHAIEKLWVSIREQQTRRKQGRSVTGKLDMNGFELLQQKYANEKISIRRSVGGGTRRAEQWLG